MKREEAISVLNDALTYLGGGLEDSPNPIEVELIENINKVIDYIETSPFGQWVSCDERMPEERDSWYSKLKGTNRYKKEMFDKISDYVLVTVQFKDGSRIVRQGYTADGKWGHSTSIVHEVVGWMPLPEPMPYEIVNESEE